MISAVPWRTRLLACMTHTHRVARRSGNSFTELSKSFRRHSPLSRGGRRFFSHLTNTDCQITNHLGKSQRVTATSSLRQILGFTRWLNFDYPHWPAAEKTRIRKLPRYPSAITRVQHLPSWPWLILGSFHQVHQCWKLYVLEHNSKINKYWWVAQ